MGAEASVKARGQNARFAPPQHVWRGATERGGFATFAFRANTREPSGGGATTLKGTFEISPPEAP